MGRHVPQFAAIAAHLDRMKKLEVIAHEICKIERAAALDVAASALFRAEAET